MFALGRVSLVVSISGSLNRVSGSSPKIRKGPGGGPGTACCSSNEFGVLVQAPRDTWEKLKMIEDS